eukprot:PITA_04077
MLVDKEMIARILPFGGLDHWPVQLEVQGIGTPKKRPFRFENIWLTHPDFISNIAKWWAEDLHIQVKKVVEDKMQELNQALITDGLDKVRNDQVTKHHQDWENLCKEEEIFRRQKSRVQWLKEGERNTSFFHRSTMANRSHNRISSIKDEGGHLLNSHEDIETVLVQHFRGIAKETILDRDHFIRDLTRHIPKLVTREDNFNLNRPVTKEEVSKVIKEMQNGKAPGPDGFNVDFFKACWNIVKQDILNVVEDSRMNRTILKMLNTSFISLIPSRTMLRL